MKLELDERRGLTVRVAKVENHLAAAGEKIVRIIDQLPMDADDLATAVARGGVPALRLAMKEIARRMRTGIADSSEPWQRLARPLGVETMGNHLLDCRVYNSALAEYLGLQKITSDDWATLTCERGAPAVEPLRAPTAGAGSSPLAEAKPELARAGDGGLALAIGVSAGQIEQI